MPLPEWVLGLKRPLLTGLAVAVVTALVTLMLPNTYKSTARVLPTESKSNVQGLGNLTAAAAAFGVSIPGGEGSDANFVDILTSRWTAEQLLQEEFEMTSKTWMFGSSRTRVGKLKDLLHEKNEDRAIAKIGKLVGASKDLKNKIIIVTATTKSPLLSQQLVRRSIGLLEEFLQRKGRTRGGAKAIFASARLEEAHGELSKAESAFRQFLMGNRNYMNSLDPSVRLLGLRLENEMKLRQQLVMNLTISLEQALMDEKNDIPIVNVLDPANLPIEKSGPGRFQIVLALFLLAAATAWVYENRLWLITRFFSE